MKKEMLVTELSANEMTNLDGGKPGPDTSLAYDAAWYVTTVVKSVVDLF